MDPSLARLHILLLLITASFVSVPAADYLKALPPGIAAEVQAMIAINDPEWVVNQSSGVATALGVAGATGQNLVAEYLFGSGDLGGVDLTRPALLAWRKGRAPLVAILPIDNRRQFAKSFGQVRRVDRFLMQVGEREGTIVYKQSTTEGLFEYRVLFRDGYAYLARTAEECQTLAEHRRPRRPENVPPLVMRANGPALNRMVPVLADNLSLPKSLNPFSDLPWLATVWAGRSHLIEQVANVELALAPGEDGLVKLAMAVAANADSDLAAWMARQTNNSSRLLPLVRRDGDIAAWHGSVRWKGEMEAIGRMIVNTLKEQGSEKLTPNLEQDLRTYFRMLDNREAFAGAWRLQSMRPDPDKPDVQVKIDYRGISSQNRATEFLNMQRSLDEVLLASDKLGDFGALSGLVSYGGLHPNGLQHRLLIADRNRLLVIEGDNKDHSKTIANDVIAGMNQLHPPGGTSGVVAVRVQIDEVARQLSLITASDVPTFKEQAVHFVMNGAGKDGIRFDIQLPLLDVATMLGRAGVSRLSEVNISRQAPAAPAVVKSPESPAP